MICQVSLFSRFLLLLNIPQTQQNSVVSTRLFFRLGKDQKSPSVVPLPDIDFENTEVEVPEDGLESELIVAESSDVADVSDDTVESPQESLDLVDSGELTEVDGIEVDWDPLTQEASLDRESLDDLKTDKDSIAATQKVLDSDEESADAVATGADGANGADGADGADVVVTPEPVAEDIPDVEDVVVDDVDGDDPPTEETAELEDDGETIAEESVVGEEDNNSEVVDENPDTEEVAEGIDETGDEDIEEILVETPELLSEVTRGIGSVTDPSGKLSTFWRFDGGAYEGQVGVVSTRGMEDYDLNSIEFMQEAIRRALANIIVDDTTEGAEFSGNMGDGDSNHGAFTGEKVIQLQVGEKFFLAVIPNGTFADVLASLEKGDLPTDSLRPLFSLATANPENANHFLPLVDLTGESTTFALEDIRSDLKSDWDLNDLVIKIRGANINALTMDELIETGVISEAPAWIDTPLGEVILSSKNLPGIPVHSALPAPTVAQTTVDQGGNGFADLARVNDGTFEPNRGGALPNTPTVLEASATQDIIDQVSSIDPTDVYQISSQHLKQAEISVLSGSTSVSLVTLEGEVLSQQVLGRGNHAFTIPDNVSGEVLLKFDSQGSTDGTYILKGFASQAEEPFNIDLEFTGGVTASQQEVIRAAAKSIEALIGQGLPSAIVDGKIIDDINFQIAVKNLDGAGGTLAQTKIDFMRYGTMLPAQSITQFDVNDIAELEKSGELFSVVQHEILHGLGFGNLWEAKGLVDYAGTPLAQYNGEQAVNAFQELGGLTDAISLETVGDGSAGLHWNKMLFQDELMTRDLGFQNGEDGQVISPISTVTLAALADLGYRVNLNKATPNWGLFGGSRFKPQDLTPEQIEAFRKLAEVSFVNQSGEFIPAILPMVDPDKVAPEIWAHAERAPDGEYYDWEDYRIVSGDTLSELAQRRMGSGSRNNYMWIANHNGIPNPDFIVTGETIKLPVHRPNYEQEQEAERRRREQELRGRQEDEERRRREEEERLRGGEGEERRRREEEARQREADQRRRELEEQEERLRNERERRRQDEERRREEERLRELERQREIARQQGKGGQDWFFATVLPEFGPVDPFETKLTGETVGNLVPDDYYRFTLSRGGRITADLIKLLADADLVLYDVRNKPIAWSMREGVTDEQIITDLIPGTYMLRVNSPKGVTTDYDLIVKFQHLLSATQKGPPPGWRVGGNNGGGGGGGGSTKPPGATFTDPRIEKIFKQAVADFAAPLRKTLNDQVADLKSKRDQIEREQKALIGSMSAELRQKVHANLDKVRDDKRHDINTIANGIKGDIDWLVDGTWNNIKNLIPNAVRDFGPIKSGLDGIWQAIDGSKKWLQGKIDWVQKQIQDAIWWFIQKVKDAYITGGEANIKVEEFAKEFRNQIDQQIRNLNGLIDEFRSLVFSKVNFTKSIGVDWPWVGIKFNLYDAISGKVNELANGGKGLIEKVGGFFKDRTNDVEYLVQQAIGAIASLMGDETGRVYNKMRADMQEIDNQINSLTGQTENTIRAKASQYKFDLEQMLINLGGEGKKILDLILEFGNSPVGQLGILGIEILLGLVPGIGQAIDIKDTYVALDNIYVKDQKNVLEYTNLLLALSGWVPGLGDLIKSVGKAALKGGGALVGLLAKLGADTVESIIKAIRNTDWNKIAKNLFDTLGNKWDDVAGKISGASSWIFGKLSQGFDNVRKGVSETIDNFKQSPVGQWLNEAVENLVEQINKVKTAARLRNELGERLFNDLTSDLTLPGLELLVNRLTSQGVKNLNNNLLSNSGMTIKQAATAFQRRAVGTPSLPSNLHGYGNADMSHFLDEHTFEFLDFAEVRRSGSQSMWPLGTDVAQMLEEALSLAPHPTVTPYNPISRTLSNGIEVKIGSRLRNGSVEIGQFYPVDGSPGVVSFNRTETDALMDIKNLLGI